MKDKRRNRTRDPVLNRTNRPTTLMIDFSHWDRLRAIERETGARPSVTVRRMLDAAFGGTPAE